MVNIVTGDAPALAKVLADHDGVDGLWFCGNAEDGAAMERASIHNLKQVWTTRGLKYDWFDRSPPWRATTSLSKRHAGQEHLGALRSVTGSMPGTSEENEKGVGICIKTSSPASGG